MASPSLSKADFGAIYGRPDPRDYFSTLGELGYAIPGTGATIFGRLLEARRNLGLPAQNVLDVCCSYGVVGSLLTTDLRMDDLYDHYRGLADAQPEELARIDRDWFRERRAADAARIIGLDVSEPAVRYAEKVGCLDRGFAENLETDDPSVDLRAELGDVDVVTTTGGIGYVTEKTMARLMDGTPRHRWVAAFCLRTYDFDPIAEALEKEGLVTEVAPGTFPQRRFLDATEREWAMAEATRLGHDPAGFEAEGSYHAQLFLSRPHGHAEAAPLTSLLG